ncbi:serine/threonine protein phosphatase [Rhizobium herbae]|uniref:Serine/threonine protein phosphatase n=1 Tax=Rhizobium herbae TaxID=508661 RepID=A0ABS7H7K6_9HYPH|nr:metallophosphoesterase family protein [Rhizobium herbae]MBW9063233.1 serine/threonine protein phosphatase [Rhizobium herbae]
MIRGILDFLRGGPGTTTTAQRQKLFFEGGPDHIYAVGDVHGCDDLLGRLEDRIFEDCRRREGTKWLIMLGDYVDRGPKSASVLDRLIAKPRADIRRFCLAGNHEDVMLDFLRNPSHDHQWLDFGGRETLYSYGLQKLPASRPALRNLLQSRIPDEHVAFLESLPSMLSIPGFCFVHAGLRDGVPLADQSDADLLWLRPSASGKVVATSGIVTIHGHTPVARVEVGQARVNVDTGAYMSGILSAVRLSRRSAPEIIQCS